MIPVVFQLKDRVYSIQKLQIEAEQQYLSILKDWASLLLSLCSEEERDDWLFYKTYDCPSELLLEYKDDYYETKKQARQADQSQVIRRTPICYDIIDSSSGDFPH